MAMANIRAAALTHSLKFSDFIKSENLLKYLFSSVTSESEVSKSQFFLISKSEIIYY